MADDARNCIKHVSDERSGTLQTTDTCTVLLEVSINDYRLVESSVYTCTFSKQNHVHMLACMDFILSDVSSPDFDKSLSAGADVAGIDRCIFTSFLSGFHFYLTHMTSYMCSDTNCSCAK